MTQPQSPPTMSDPAPDKKAQVMLDGEIDKLAAQQGVLRVRRDYLDGLIDELSGRISALRGMMTVAGQVEDAVRSELQSSGVIKSMEEASTRVHDLEAEVSRLQQEARDRAEEARVEMERAQAQAAAELSKIQAAMQGSKSNASRIPRKKQVRRTPRQADTSEGDSTSGLDQAGADLSSTVRRRGRPPKPVETAEVSAAAQSAYDGML